MNFFYNYININFKDKRKIFLFYFSIINFQYNDQIITQNCAFIKY